MSKKKVTKELVGRLIGVMFSEDSEKKKNMLSILDKLNIDNFNSVSDVNKVLKNKDALEELVDEVKETDSCGDTVSVGETKVGDSNEQE